MAYESPSYDVVERLGEIEIRDDDGYLAAETEVDGALEQVTIVEVGPQRVAAIRYSGRWSQRCHDRGSSAATRSCSSSTNHRTMPEV